VKQNTRRDTADGWLSTRTPTACCLNRPIRRSSRAPSLRVFASGVVRRPKGCPVTYVGSWSRPSANEAPCRRPGPPSTSDRARTTPDHPHLRAPGRPMLADLAYQGGGPWLTTGIKRRPLQELTPIEKTVNRAPATARAPGRTRRRPLEVLAHLRQIPMQAEPHDANRQSRPHPGAATLRKLTGRAGGWRSQTVTRRRVGVTTGRRPPSLVSFTRPRVRPNRFHGDEIPGAETKTRAPNAPSTSTAP
jgi:hypothetical protein